MDTFQSLPVDGSLNIARDRHLKRAYILTFMFDHALTTIRIVFGDSSGADVVITNMTTLPEAQQGKGYGSRALKFLLPWVAAHGCRTILAVQVQTRNERFWKKNGFVPLRNISNDFVYSIEGRC